ncbi:MAG: AI-2E family transporter [Firmicutes bacterium]|nr:AI-2E family transporter [Bacillota bacterium]
MEDKSWQERSWNLSVRIIFLLLIILAVVLFIQKIAWVISLILISTLIVYTLSPLSNFLTKKGLPHTISVLFVYSLLFVSVLLFFYFLIPTIISELRTLTRFLATDYRALLPQILTQIDSLLESESLNQTLQNLAQDLPNTLQGAIITLTNLTANIFSRLSEVILVLFLVFYLLRDLAPTRQGIIRIFPKPWQKEASLVLEIIDCKVGAYLRGNLLRCLIVGTLTGVALSIVGMPFALMFGVLAGLLNIIVYIGPYLAGIPAVLLALTASTPHPLLIVAIYVFIQAIDAFTLTPLLLGRAVDLMPFTVIVSLLVGGQLFGLLGILLAIPVAATLKVVIYHYYYGENCNLSSSIGDLSIPSLAKSVRAVKAKISKK